MKDICKRLDRLETALKQQHDPVFAVTLTDGTIDQCDFETAWSYFRDGKENLVQSVSVDRPDYIENAALLEILCKS